MKKNYVWVMNADMNSVAVYGTDMKMIKELHGNEDLQLLWMIDYPDYGPGVAAHVKQSDNTWKKAFFIFDGKDFVTAL